MNSESRRITLCEVNHSVEETRKERLGNTMERWRSYFAKAGADIWTIIEEAILLAATDYPKEFKAKRSEIAETLFARRLLQLHSGDTHDTRLSGSVVTNATNAMEENEVRNHEERMPVTRVVERNEGERLLCSYDDAEALTDEMDEETLLLKEVHQIKETITENDQSESTILDSLQRLEDMQFTVEALKATEIGKHVNGLRKHCSKRVSALVKRLVGHWKDLVDEWVKSAEDMTDAAVAGSEQGEGDISEAGNEDRGSPSPLLDEDPLLVARTPSLEMPQPFSYINDETYGQARNKEGGLFSLAEPLIKDNLYYPSKSQSGSILTDCNDYDAKATTSRSRVPEERGSATRDFHASGRMEGRLESTSRLSTSQCGNYHEELTHYGALSVSKSVKGGSGPGRPSNDISKVRVAWTGRSDNDMPRMNKSHDLQRTAGLVSSNNDNCSKASNLNKATTVDKGQAERLEIAKRHLHERYQQAENAKKQRTVQLVDLPDLPNLAQMGGKMNVPVHSKSGSQSGQWNQNRR